MSVINQMLKDLQQRQGDQQTESGAVRMPVGGGNKSNKPIALIVIITVVLTLLTVYMLQLREENQRLKYVEKTASHEQKIVNTLPVVTTSLPIVSPTVQTQNAPKQQLVPVNKYSLNEDEPVTPEINTLAPKKIASASPTAEPKISPKIVTPKKAATITKVATSKPSPKKSSSIHISRRQMTPEALTKQKMNRAKEAIANNDIAKAEQLFEDILLVMPSHLDARKQLAALWFGRRSYQAAINLLSQGIYLAPEDPELRMLKARIYSKQKQHFQAYKVLQGLPNINSHQNIEYLSLLATEAQTSQQFSAAARAYTQLSDLQSSIGKWWLGLAIAYDSNSLFEQAVSAYKKALETQDLSTGTTTFAKNRIKALGE